MSVKTLGSSNNTYSIYIHHELNLSCQNLKFFGQIFNQMCFILFYILIKIF